MLCFIGVPGNKDVVANEHVVANKDVVLKWRMWEINLILKSQGM